FAEIAGGELLGGLVDVYPQKPAREQIYFRGSRYEELTGLKIELGEAERILRSLGFSDKADVEKDSLEAVAPTWRVDISLEEDLIEEVARIAGYDNVQNTLPGNSGAGAYLFGEEKRRSARHLLTGLGYNEAINFSFVNGETDELVGGVPDDARLALRNPIDETEAHMRTTLIGGLLRSVELNFNHGTRNVRLFEIGKCFTVLDNQEVDETERLALVATGARNENDWQAASARLDFYDLKGTVEAIFEVLGLPTPDFEPIESLSFLHPGRAAEIYLGTTEVGEMGQLHPRVA